MTTAEHRLHQEVWGLLPWLANGRATGEQRHLAERHLAGCPDCRAELAREQRLAAGMAQPSVPGPTLSQGLARLMQRVDQVEPARPPRPWLAAWAGRGPTIRLSTAALLGTLQLALFAAGAAWFFNAAPTAAPTNGYQTLTSAPTGASSAAVPALRVVCHPGRPISELQTLLVGHGLTIIAGPTEAGVFTLGLVTPPAGGDLDALAAELRRSPVIAFAEATGQAPAR
jgi:hypothetical protein